MSTDIPTYEGLIHQVHDLLKNVIETIPRTPYAKMLRDLRKKPPVEGVYLIFDEKDKPFYIGKAKNLKMRLLEHARLGGDIVLCFLWAEGFSPYPQKVHRCECGKPIECRLGNEKIEDNRQEVCARIQARILSEFKVALISTKTSTYGLPLGVREIERLVQYLLVPTMGNIQHRTKGWVSIEQHVKENPLPADLAADFAVETP